MIRAVVATVLICGSALAAESPVDFGRDIQPLLSDRCYKCHGPDEAKREGNLRFDVKESAFASREGRRSIVPGDVGRSELVRRITEHDPELRMPPPDSKLSLSDREIELLKRWIAEGAKWGGHWAFQTPVRPSLPVLGRSVASSYAKNAIDHFVVLERLQAGLQGSPEASRTTLIRRATLDLTGLPPTPEEIATFLADQSPDAYERLLDRLLASPRYGEQMALPWLDAARYADTSGYQNDGPRQMWRWRDWVIEALNADLPFDQFTIEQLAGDLLPNPTLEQRIATGFNRNHRGNSEGGIIAEEYAVEYVVDRVDTTATVWMGLTLGCTRCHDHKYDPFTQREFYQLYAYFNSIPEAGRAIKEGNSPPYIAAPTREQRAQIAAAEKKLAAAQQALSAAKRDIDSSQANWERQVDSANVADWSPDDGLVVTLPLDQVDSPALSSCDGVSGQAVQLDGKSFVNAGDVANFGYFDKFTLAAWVRPDKQLRGTILSRMTDEVEGDGYSIVLSGGKLQVLLVKRWLDDSLRVETADNVIEPERWQHVCVVYDGSRLASGVRLYVDGQLKPLKAQLDALNQTFAALKEPLRIGAGNGPDARFRGAIDEVRIFNRALKSGEVLLLAQPESIRDLLGIAAPKRTPQQHAKLQTCFLRRHAPEPLRQLLQTVDAAAKQLEALADGVSNVMIMQELPQPRPAHVLVRGQYDHPGKPVERGTPATLPPLAKDAPYNRLGLAKWLVDPQHPLTARVAVNRQWQTFFGAGLVRTPEDFGTQGQRPTHPALLDWLATELVHRDWSMKELHRLIATSATYRQSSRISAAGMNDPDNRLLARGPRVRLSAQALRDQALFASGLLVERLGGPSVKPYQPPGLWEELANQTYEQGKGADLYRRSLYTYWKRTAASPSMMTFDASDRETCTVRRSRTNTPLQALTLLNEVTFVEAARVLAERVLVGRASPPAKDDPARLTLMFELVASRRPTDRELKVLQQGLDYQRQNFAARDDEITRLMSQGEYDSKSSLDRREVAAYAAIANLLLNLDEAITKE
jgi:hypothetical protein